MMRWETIRKKNVTIIGKQLNGFIFLKATLTVVRKRIIQRKYKIELFTRKYSNNKNCLYIMIC